MDINDIKIIIDDTINYIEKKYPNENNTNDRWLALIGEEYGELCMAINDGEINNVIEEGTQTCAAIILMLRDFVKKNALRSEDVDKDLKCYALKDRKGVVHYIKAKDKASAIRKYIRLKDRRLKDYDTDMYKGSEITLDMLENAPYGYYDTPRGLILSHDGYLYGFIKLRQNQWDETTEERPHTFTSEELYNAMQERGIDKFTLFLPKKLNDSKKVKDSLDRFEITEISDCIHDIKEVNNQLNNIEIDDKKKEELNTILGLCAQRLEKLIED